MSLLAKIRSLPQERVAEVEDFVDFLCQREQERALRRATTKLSGPAFASMTGFEFGDVILVPFPFTDHSAPKQRPAVVVSSGAYHLRRPDLIMMAVTSQLHSAAFGDTPITEWQAAGLLKPSMPKPLVATVDQHLVRRKLGRLQHVDLEALRGTLRAILGSWISRG